MDKVSKTNVIPFTKSPRIGCPSCGSHELTTSNEIEEFQYGTGADTAILSSEITVHHCPSCGTSFTSEDANVARHEAVCRHLGVFTPQEVRAVREKNNLNQAEFANLTKIGTASLSRWESGLLIQNKAYDNYLYLLAFVDNIQRIRDRSLPTLAPDATPFKPKFRCIDDEDYDRLNREAKHFELYAEAV